MNILNWFNPWWWYRRRRHRPHGVGLLIRVQDRRATWYQPGKWRQKFYRLTSNGKDIFMTDVVVGHNITYTIVYLDQNGQPMLTSVTPDSPPAWSNLAAPTIDTMSISADGSTDSVSAVGAGADSVTVSVTVGGVTFTAVDQVSISAAPQVLGAVALNAVVS
jgi:hypothetical protein